MQAYSMDLRKRVLADSDAGMPTKQVAEKYGVSGAWVRWLKQRRRETGEIAPRVGGGAQAEDRPREAGGTGPKPSRMPRWPNCVNAWGSSARCRPSGWRSIN